MIVPALSRGAKFKCRMTERVAQPVGRNWPTADRGQPSSNPTTTLGSFEVLRFVAALVVCVSHAVPTVARHASDPGAVLFGGMLPPGALAVQFFFVLSGFVMMTAHRGDFGRWHAPLRFWCRRAGRIYPVYWIALLIVCIYLGGALNLTYGFQLFSLLPVDVNEFVVTAWTLRFEMTFYLVFGLCLFPVIGRALLAGWIVLVVWTWFWPIVTATEAGTLPQARFWASAKYFVSYFNFYFFAGLLAGYVFSVRVFSTRVSCLLLFGGVMAVALQLPWTRWGDGYGIPLVMLLSALSFGAALLGLAGLERAGALPCGTIARRLGVISYPLYILHTPLLLVIDLEASGVRMSTTWLYVMTPVVLLVLILISAAVAFCIDRPLQRALRRVTSSI